MKNDGKDIRFHPTDPKKGTYFEETQKALERYAKKREEMGLGNSFEMK